MPDELQSDIFLNPRKILQDLRSIGSQRSRISNGTMDALIERAAKTIQEVKPGSREWDRIARFFVGERRLEQDRSKLEFEIEKVILAHLAPQVATAIQVNVNQQGSERDDLDRQLDKRIESALAALETDDEADSSCLPIDQDGSDADGPGSED